MNVLGIKIRLPFSGEMPEEKIDHWIQSGNLRALKRYSSLDSHNVSKVVDKILDNQNCPSKILKDLACNQEIGWGLTTSGWERLILHPNFPTSEVLSRWQSGRAKQLNLDKLVSFGRFSEPEIETVLTIIREKDENDLYLLSQLVINPSCPASVALREMGRPKFFFYLAINAPALQELGEESLRAMLANGFRISEILSLI